MKKRLAALALSLALLLLLLPAPASAAGDIYFTAINDNLLPLTADTMPVWVDGMLYVPYTVFDSASTGSNLRISWNQNKTRNTFTLYTLNETLVFDLTNHNAMDAHSGAVYSYRAITRNNKIYLPVYSVCNFFGLSFSRLSTQYGYLIRIKNASVVLSDQDFVDAAASLMESRLARYNQSLAPTEPDPEPSPSPSQPVTDPSHSGVKVYLAFRCTEEGRLSQILDTLDNYRYTALFLFRPGDVEALAPLVRRAVARGHSVGFLLSEDSGSLTAQMEAGNASLARTACTQTCLFAMESGSGQALTDLGYVEYRPNVDGVASAARVMSRVSAKTSKARILFDTGATSLYALPQVVLQLRQGKYNIRPAVESEF